jgi:phage FluMu protein Com
MGLATNCEAASEVSMTCCQDTPTRSTDELRCPCRRLLARVDGRRLVLKCPRCKTEAVVDLDRDEHEIEVNFTR